MKKETIYVLTGVAEYLFGCGVGLLICNKEVKALKQRNFDLEQALHNQAMADADAYNRLVDKANALRDIIREYESKLEERITKEEEQGQQ